MRSRLLITIGMGFLVAACGKPAEDASAPASSTETVAAAPAENPLAQCLVCHRTVKDAPNGLGPNLFGIVGKKAGSAEGFNYSPAMKASGLTWDEATLDKYLEAPATLVPGGRMAYAGQKDAVKRAAMVEALKGLK
jgi:cytochrome c